MNKEQRRANGQYSHSSEKVCQCGRRKGTHDAEFPFSFGDLVMEELPSTHPNFEKECEGFKIIYKK